MKTLYQIATAGRKFQRIKHELDAEFTERTIKDMDLNEFLQLISDAMEEMQEDKQPVDDAPADNDLTQESAFKQRYIDYLLGMREVPHINPIFQSNFLDYAQGKP
jgi:hypothetical protein